MNSPNKIDFLGAFKVQSFGDALKIEASVNAIEKMLKTELYAFKHINHGFKHIKHINGLEIPKEIADQVYMITGLSSFPFVTKQTNPKSTQKNSVDSNNHIKRYVS